jgi:predicted metal-binding membrane protein
MTESTLDRVLRRDRMVVAAALALLSATAWAYTLRLADSMRMGGMDMTGYRMIPGLDLMVPAIEPWGGVEVGFVFVMWAVMMIGMMTPSAAPMILLYARVGRQAAAQSKPFAATAWFAGGYLLAWSGFALVATIAQWAFDRIALLTPMMESASPVLGGIVLIAAGLYQWSPLKNACLRQCQAPWQFIHNHGGFRREAKGSLALGFRHGAYCIGCCWTLMALLFVGGVMNILWIAAIAAFVLVEKVVPAGRIISRTAGTCFLLVGFWLLAARPA